MHLSGILDWLSASSAWRTWAGGLAQAQTPQSLQAIRAARPFLAAALARAWAGPIVVVSSSNRRVHHLVEQLSVWLRDERPILRYADPGAGFYDRIAWDSAVIHERLEALDALLRDDAPRAPIVVASLRALMQRTLPPSLYRQHTLRLRVRQRLPLDKLASNLLGLGYEPAALVSAMGTFSRRGGLLDVFPMHAVKPVKIDFFDDEIDFIKLFDPATQRTQGQIDQIVIPPAREALPALMPPVAHHLEGFFARLGAQHGEMSALLPDLDGLRNAAPFPVLEFYWPYALPQVACLLDYLPDDALILVDDLSELQDEAVRLLDAAVANRANNILTHQLPDDMPAPYVDWERLAQELNARRVVLLSNQPQRDAPVVFSPAPRLGGQLKALVAHLAEGRAQGQAQVIVTDHAERVISLWQEQSGEPFTPRLEALPEAPTRASLAFVVGQISEGWVATHEGGTLSLIGDSEIFSWTRHEPRRRQARPSPPPPEADYADWQPGQFVVHVDFGVGCYRGLQRYPADNGELREYLAIDYEGTDKLYVPIHQADRLTRFVGADDAPPRLNSLGRPAEWQRAKNRAARAAEEEAQELLSIYARRAASPGYAYSPDSEWQHELEASFPFVETVDQLRVIREIKADMESPRPMDRLVCGDVGFGKTEVAIRAAFKAVMDGKQVAVLVPTTVLAEQHYHTFKRRIAAFPFQIEAISRFRSKAEQEAVLRRLLKGEVDILIGTHRLLSDDVVFRDLGLLIIDEEQKFGVKHKEHFKKLRSQVDVLTLTATPIPRTLYLSLSGVRDISMIQTPPEDRLPVITHVGVFDPRLARHAILRELDRGGQVFVIHNRVKTIDMLRERLLEIVPEARVMVAHGQMSGKQLESIITQFSAGEADILLSTSIIENGIDMPNVNTILVDRADWFGLSELYQLRGRVGRSSTQAYAYFFHPRASLTEEARARLETLAEHASLGMGFQVATRDLELRGAGDILSTRQSGHVANVGLQLYTRLLQQAVARLKAQQRGETPPAPPISQSERILIDLPVAAYLPEAWIAEMALRLQLYRRIGNLQSLSEVEALAEELRDRFGELPSPVEGLLYLMRVKLLAMAIHASAVQQPRDRILIKLSWLTEVQRECLAQRLGDDVDVSRTAVELRAVPATWRTRLLEVLSALPAYAPRLTALRAPSGL
ncbi:MAG: transcription-repair coupling factor [Anaerolineae bacterium]|nr:transcription-repair coupling factor [Anaerolineae bacterium]MDW8174012.1 transcription-repair coupling factor [Anaerolineae bacterium]